MQEKVVTSAGAAIWESRWIRFRMALKQAGVEPRMHDFCRAWVWGFLGFIKLGRFHQAGIGYVEGYLQKLAGEGKEIWQVRQAEESLRVFYQEVEPTGWGSGGRLMSLGIWNLERRTRTKARRTRKGRVRAEARRARRGARTSERSRSCSGIRM